MSAVDRGRLNPGISVDNDSNDRVRLTIWREDHQGAEYRLMLDPERALDLMADLANHVRYAATHAASTIQLGDCATCGNTRLVEIPGPGRNTNNERCPDCAPRYSSALERPFARPRIGGGIE